MNKMKEVFEETLQKDPFDTTTRLVYADWLEENGCDDEAEEQRRRATTEWLEAARWLADFAARCGTTIDNYDEYCQSSTRIYYRDHPDSRYRPRDPAYVAKPNEQPVLPQERALTLDDMIQAGRDWIDREEYFVQQGSETARDLMYFDNDDERSDANLRLFWHNWQIVTNEWQNYPDRLESPFTCSC